MSDKEGAIKKTTRMETSELIELVRVRPCLWDRSDPMYRNRVEKHKAWDEINRALEPSYRDMSRNGRQEFGMMINRKWCNIRDCYKKYLNGTSRVNGSGRPYLYAEMLTFLDSVYDSNDPCRKKKDFNIEAKDSTGEADAEEREEWLSEVFVDMDTTDGEPLPGPAKNIKMEFSRPKETLEPEEGIVSVLVNLIEREEDEDRAFFKSITPTVKSLSDDDKFVFRIQVMKLLSAIKKKETRPPSLKRGRLSHESESD